MTKAHFLGYERPDGSVGIRNSVAVIYTVDCARVVSEAIAKSIPNGIAVGWFSCNSTEDEKDIDMLIGIGRNPNVGSAIVTGLGCQNVSPSQVAKGIAKTGKPTRVLTIQGTGGTRNTIDEGTQIARGMSSDLSKLLQADFPISKLSIGVSFDGGWTLSRKRSGSLLSLVKCIVHDGGKILVSSDLMAGKETNTLILGPGKYPNQSGLYEVDGMVARSSKYYGLESDSELTDFASAGAQLMIRFYDGGFGVGNVVSPTINVYVGGSSGLGIDDADLKIKNNSDAEKVKSRMLRYMLDTASGQKTKAEAMGKTEGGIIIGGRPLLRFPTQVCE